MKKQGGFTIIEVSLFLSISALVAVALLAGLRSMVTQQQWRDSINTMRTLIQTEYQNVRSSINNRASAPSACADVTGAGTSNCWTIGRVIQFTVDSKNYKVYDVVAKPASNSCINSTAQPCDDDIVALNAASMKLSASTTSTIPWQNNFVRGALIGDGSTTATTSSQFNTIAILQSPISSAILVFGLDMPGAPTTMPTLPNSPTSHQYNSPLAFIIQDGGTSNFGAICLGAGSSSSNVVVASPVAKDISNANLKERCQV